ncbi:hypothetical protein MMC25_000616 [Agyrium rufum]|nr:hypothetical protein [Agyrium rufum]
MALRYEIMILLSGLSIPASLDELAARLSEDPNVSVLLLERGMARDTWVSRVPLNSSNVLSEDTGSTLLYSEPMTHLENRQALLCRGEILGGGSRINSMVYTRGSVGDYNAWAAMGHPNWSYEKVLPMFVKAENALAWPESKYRGNSGETCVSFQACAGDLGYPPIADNNSPDALCDGLATHEYTVNEQRQRVSTKDAYLPKDLVMNRRNLTICTGAIVSCIHISENLSKNRADKVEFCLAESRSNRLFTVRVRKEVIVSSGTLGSPQVLLLSGLGPRQHLEDHGIKVIRDLPGVGSNLNDHVAIPVAWEIPVNESLTQIANSPLLGLVEFIKYLFGRTGMFSIPFLIISLFVRGTSLDDQTADLITKETTTSSHTNESQQARQSPDFLPDIEIMPLATSAMDDIEEHKARFAKVGIFSLLTSLQRPKSRGTVRLRSADPRDTPKIDMGFMSDPADFILARKAVRLAMKLGAAMKAQGFPILRSLTAPDPDAKDVEEQIDELIRHRARSAFHYSSSCRIASEDDPTGPGVVDDQLRVHGVPNLRVCDASVFPQVVSSHLQAPVVMVAEKCANMIKNERARPSKLLL